MKKSILKLLFCTLVVSITVLCSIACSGCFEKGEKGDKGDQGIQGEKGETGEAGQNGKDGVDGKDGLTPTIEISEDGYWVINGEKTDYLAVGKEGEKGDQGEQGLQGDKGDTGATGQDGAKGDKGDQGEQGTQGEKGEAGVGIESVRIDEEGHLKIKYTNSETEIDLGKIKDVPDCGDGEVDDSEDETVDSSTRKKLEIEQAVNVVKRTSVSVRMEGGGVASAILIDASFSSSVVNDESCVYILTCHHVVSSKGVINIVIPDKNFGVSTTYENPNYVFAGVIGKSNATAYLIGDDTKAPVDTAITLVGSDAESDVAVLKLDLTKRAISGNKLTKDDLVLAKVPPKDYKTQIGETVFAVGNPTGGLPGTVSLGIISYLERDVSINELGTMRLMQIDVLTNPGSSGGGLYNLYGELIGITNSGLEERHGLNNAIPLSVIADDGMDNGFVNIASSLIATCTYDGENGNFGYVPGRRVKFGFSVTKETISGKEYVKVVSVNAGTPSAQAGLKVNDCITKLKVNSTEYSISSFQQFTEKMTMLKMDDTVELTVSRTVAFEQVEHTITLRVSQFIFCDTGV